MTLFFIPDPERFLRLVERSRGNVLLRLPDGGQANLKESYEARQLLRMISPGQVRLEISLSDSEDVPAFLQYMMEGGRA